MPLPSKRKGEKRSDFVSRCVSFESKNSKDKSIEQIIAICNSQYDKARAEEILKELIDGKRLSLLARRREISTDKLGDQDR